MKILVACDSFKGCMTSKQANEAIIRGILKANETHEFVSIPMADGGEGTASVLCSNIDGSKVSVHTLDAYGNEIETYYVLSKDEKTAIMDVASCIGLSMVSKYDRNPFITNSCGVGIMMKDAIQRGCERIVIGLGGSSTNDGGMGILEEFGVSFYNNIMEKLKPNPYALKHVDSIDISNFQKPNVEIIVACDVNIHLLGPMGTTYFFGKQKCFYHNQIHEVDRWMHNYRDKIQEVFHVDLDTFEGGGTAGGIGACLIGLFGAKMIPGAKLVARLSHMEELIQDCDLVITGEGQTDRQTEYGKVPFEVLMIANKYNKKTICLSGALGIGYQNLYNYGMAGIFSSSDRAMTFQVAIEK
ncbi:MAG: glycerate kinase, partial [Firmicutes bacterium]|nr:glycerate kinase [Bacillota bacterium]